MIQKIHIQNFRKFTNNDFSFSDTLTVIVGANAAGKTNLLESIFLLSFGKSFKSAAEQELINVNNDFARIKARLNKDLKLEILLTKDKHKKYLVNDVPKRLVDFGGILKVVLFSPQDLDLVTSSPSLRRKFLDNVLSLSDKEYRRSIISYEKGLRQRNRLLFRIREEGLSRSQLLFWDQLLIKNADYITNSREEFINFINSRGNNFLIYDKSIISASRLEKYANAEIASATTLVGPHRDDFIFQIRNHNLASFGSRGEQRMSVLWLKLAELSYIEKKTGEKPTLLLDDIFSELDVKHRDIVFEIAKNQQTIITTADPHFLIDNKDIERIQF